MSFTNFSTGSAHSFGGTCEELVPGKLLRYRDVFEAPDLPGEMRMTIELREVSSGTDLRITQGGVPDIIPAITCWIARVNAVGCA